MTQMKTLIVKSTKAQMKIQQTAFMLVALVLFFSMVGLIYFSISLANTRERASDLYEKEALETVKMLSGTPELAFTAGSGCSSCIDLYKALALETDTAKDLWNFDYLEIEIVYPIASSTKITLIDRGQQKPKTAFVTIVSWDNTKLSYVYELGKIHATQKNITN
mgnify:CR=1 FL=1